MVKDLGKLEQELVQGGLGLAPLVQVGVNCVCTLHLGLLRKAGCKKFSPSVELPKVYFYYLTNSHYLQEKVQFTKMNYKMPKKKSRKFKYN